jgi:hypothetical protein
MFLFGSPEAPPDLGQQQVYGGVVTGWSRGMRRDLMDPPLDRIRHLLRQEPQLVLIAVQRHGDPIDPKELGSRAIVAIQALVSDPRQVSVTWADPLTEMHDSSSRAIRINLGSLNGVDNRTDGSSPFCHLQSEKRAAHRPRGRPRAAATGLPRVSHVIEVENGPRRTRHGCAGSFGREASPMADDVWTTFEPSIAPLLGEEDDPDLWAAVVNALYPDAQTLCRSATGIGRIVTQLGRCSHWLRPHQSRWTDGGGFAWPSGYDGPRFSRSGLPEFDWFSQWEWCPASGKWAAMVGDPPPNRLMFRVAVPSRSRRHRQAAVHTVWQPGTPVRPRTPLVQFYGFRERSGWSCTAYRASPSERAYELAVERQDDGPGAVLDRRGM